MNRGVLILLFVTLVWGTTFPVIRAATARLDGADISAARFVIAGLCMVPFALKASRSAWRDGAILGLVGLMSYVTQAVGLEYITSNRSAFITGLNVLMVPFLGLLWGGRLNVRILIAALLACTGIGLMSWESGVSWRGDTLTLLCAFSYAVYVILLSRFLNTHPPRTLAATQVVVMALAGLLWLPASHWQVANWQHLLTGVGSVWPSLVYLGVVASAGMLFLQAVGQRQVSVNQAAVIYAMEPVFAALFGWLWLGEALGPRGFAGGAMVVAAVILGEWRSAKQTESHARV